MKNLIQTAVAGFILATSFGALGQSLSSVVYDDFTPLLINTNLIDTNKWEIRKTFSDSEVFVSSGNAVLLNRGKLLSRTAFPTNLVIRTKFKFSGSQNDVFRIVWRSNGDDSNISNGGREMLNGVRLSIQLAHSENGFAGSIALDWSNHPIAAGSFGSVQTNLQANTFYDVCITDNENQIKVFFGTNSLPLITGTFSTNFGNKITFYNREGAGGGSSISSGSRVELDYVDIQDSNIPRLNISVSKVKVSGNLLIGSNYVLESSFKLANWTNIGPSFTATNDIVTGEFDVDVTGRFFRIRQVP